MRKFGTLVALMAAAGGGGAAVAAPSFTECPAVGHAASCNVLITIGASGEATVARDPLQPGYGGFDGTLVGVLNNWSNPVASLPISGSRIFALNGKGMCSSGFGAPGNCSEGLNQGDPYDYTGDFVSFSIGGLSTGTVNFIGGLSTGSSTYFSIEGVPAATLTAGSPTSEPSGAEAPEPGTYWLVISSGFLVLCFVKFRRRPARITESAKTSGALESHC
jgi:hypothetical protein